MSFDLAQLAGMRVTIMGLGLHGGGAASAAFFAGHGAEVTVTDLRDEAELSASIEALSPYPLRYVLGRHEERDFREADIVIKNPAVPLSSPYLAAARLVETDISIFLQLCSRPVAAITGSKGKSTVASALHHAVSQTFPSARLGGNITVSPLTFLDEMAAASPETPVVLELSSWQLADLRGKGVLRPRVAAITNILPDHQNRYRSMEEYVGDKRLIYADQGGDDFTLCNLDDAYGRDFARETRGQVRLFSARGLAADAEGGWLEGRSGLVRVGGAVEEVVPEQVKLPGPHNRLNLLVAALAARLMGVASAIIRERLAAFEGIPHRLSLVREWHGVRFYNDSAATIPEATVAAIESFTGPVILIAGGTDKSLDFAVLRPVASRPKEIVLLSGSATAKAVAILEQAGRSYRGPFASLDAALACALERAQPGDTVLFSPGCASFEMFRNEFDRGLTFVSLVGALPA